MTVSGLSGPGLETVRLRRLGGWAARQANRVTVAVVVLSLRTRECLAHLPRKVTVTVGPRMAARPTGRPGIMTRILAPSYKVNHDVQQDSPTRAGPGPAWSGVAGGDAAGLGCQNTW